MPGVVVGSRFGQQASSELALGDLGSVSRACSVRACCGLNSGEKTGRAERDLEGNEAGQAEVCWPQLPTSKLFSNRK